MRLKIVFGIHRATHRIGLYIQRHEPDLTQAEAHILCHLHETGDSAVADLHRAFAHKRSTLTSVLDRLESRAWITRQTSRQDRRSFIIGLTRTGKAKAAKIHRVLEQLEAGALRGTDPDDVGRCNQLLSKVEELSEQ